MLIFLIIAHCYQTAIQHPHLYNWSFYLVKFSADDTKNVMNNQSPIKTWSLYDKHLHASDIWIFLSLKLLIECGSKDLFMNYYVTVVFVAIYQNWKVSFII